MTAHTLIKTSIVFILVTFGCQAIASIETIDTHIGKITLQNGYPSPASISQLYNELDFQRAVQA